jgi:hypothetical protein
MTNYPDGMTYTPYQLPPNLRKIAISNDGNYLAALTDSTSMTNVELFDLPNKSQECVYVFSSLSHYYSYALYFNHQTTQLGVRDIRNTIHLFPTGLND